MCHGPAPSKRVSELTVRCGAIYRPGRPNRPPIVCVQGYCGQAYYLVQTMRFFSCSDVVPRIEVLYLMLSRVPPRRERRTRSKSLQNAWFFCKEAKHDSNEGG